MSKAIIFSEDKPNVIDMLNEHIKKRIDPIRAMNIEEVEINVEKMRWEFEYSIARMKDLKQTSFKVAPLEEGDSVLERIKKRTPAKKKGKGRKRKTGREKMLELGIHTAEELDAMGVK